MQAAFFILKYNHVGYIGTKAQSHRQRAVEVLD